MLDIMGKLLVLVPVVEFVGGPYGDPLMYGEVEQGGGIDLGEGFVEGLLPIEIVRASFSFLIF